MVINTHQDLNSLVETNLLILSEGSDSNSSNMGSSASKQTDEKVVCIDCDKKTQKDLPSDETSLASKGMACEGVYGDVGK